MLKRVAGLSRMFVPLLAAATALELVLARGTSFVQHERVRARLPLSGDAWWELGAYVTTFAGLLAVVTIAALGLRLVVTRLSPAGRGLGLGFSTTIAALGLTAVFLPPDVKGILTIHLAVVLGGMALGIVTLASPGRWEVKVVSVLPLLLPPLATAALAMPGREQAVLRVGLVIASGLVAAGVVAAAVRRVRRAARASQLIVVAYSLVVACLAAGAALLHPRRVVEFVLFSHGLLLGFRGALAFVTLAVLGIAFAAAAFVLPQRDAQPTDGDGRLLGLGLLLSFLAGPTPLSATQSLLLAAGSLALVVGARDPAPAVMPWELEDDDAAR